MDRHYVEVYSANGLLEAETIKIFLEAYGMTVMITQESVGTTYGLTAGALGMSHIYVPADQEKEALELLSSMEKGDFDPGTGPSKTEE
jgi:hypothetical protein